MSDLKELDLEKLRKAKKLLVYDLEGLDLQKLNLRMEKMALDLDS